MFSPGNLADPYFQNETMILGCFTQAVNQSSENDTSKIEEKFKF